MLSCVPYVSRLEAVSWKILYLSCISNTYRVTDLDAYSIDERSSCWCFSHFDIYFKHNCSRCLVASRAIFDLKRQRSLRAYPLRKNLSRLVIFFIMRGKRKLLNLRHIQLYYLDSFTWCLSLIDDRCTYGRLHDPPPSTSLQSQD